MAHSTDRKTEATAPPVLSAGVHVRAVGSAGRLTAGDQLSYVPVLVAAAPAPKVADFMSISLTMSALPRAKQYARYSTGAG